MSSGLEIFSKNVWNAGNLGLYVMYRDERGNFMKDKTSEEINGEYILLIC